MASSPPPAPSDAEAALDALTASLNNELAQLARRAERATRSAEKSVLRSLRAEMHRPAPAVRPRVVTPAPVAPKPAAVAPSPADPDRQVLEHLRSAWAALNRQHFGGQLSTPVLELATDLPEDEYGRYLRTDAGSTIRLSRALLTGDHPDVQPGAEFAAGRLALVEDVLAHEVAHQGQVEVENATEPYWRGHGPAFARLANRIGARANLRPAAGGWEALGAWPWAQRWPSAYGGAFAVGARW